MQRLSRILLGVVLWTGLVVALVRVLVVEDSRVSATCRDLYRNLQEEHGSLTLELPELVLAEVGDEVLLRGTERRVIGEIWSLLDESGRPRPTLYDWCRSVEVRIFDRTAVELHEDARVELIRVPQTAAWVFKTLLTEENLPRIAEEWNNNMLAHRDEIFALLTPIVRDIILDLQRHVERELPRFVERHRDEIQALGEQIRAGFLDDEFARFFEKALWPIAEPHVQPLVTRISREIWEQLPVWGLSWRVVYQSLPFTANDHVQREWSGFLEERVLPILRSHSGDVVAAARTIAKEVLAREEVAGHLRRTFDEVVASPRFHELVRVFLREVVLDNAVFQETMRRRWRSRPVQSALQVTTGYLEPTVRKIGDILLGTREDGITSEFARVLRSQILLKELQHIEIEPGSKGAPALADGATLRASVRWDR